MEFKISDVDVHPHLRARMNQRGVSEAEIERAMNSGEPALDAKAGTLGKRIVVPYNSEWGGQIYAAKEVTVYYKIIDQQIVLLTVIARYGEGFSQR